MLILVPSSSTLEGLVFCLLGCLGAGAEPGALCLKSMYSAAELLPLAWMPTFEETELLLLIATHRSSTWNRVINKTELHELGCCSSVDRLLT